MTETLTTHTDADEASSIDESARALIFGATTVKPRTIINLHALHAVPPSLLNRDNLNAQKTVTQGGVVRVRVSSACWKRAMRTWVREQAIAGGAFAARSNRWPAAVAEALVTSHGVERDVATTKAGAVFKALGFKVNERGATAAQIFAHQDLAVRVAEAIAGHLDAIGEEVGGDGKVKLVVPDEVVAAGRAALSVSNAVDLALFGRMLAEQPVGGEVTGAVSVDHASSVDPAAIVEDFFTAVDDLTPEGEAVSGNLGVSDLSSPVFYRTASIDVDQLRRNLSGAADPDALTAAAVAVLIEAFAVSVPSAKQRSSNVGTRPSLVVATTGPARLTAHNAFTAPIRGENVVADATAALFAVLEAQNRFGAPQPPVVLAGDPAAEGAIPAGVATVGSLRELTEAVTR
ncbi:type I-E CRISPR-associated protein Cas7/Cse4/CasC [Mycolicibacterium llatzerense]|uniref:type I-E CRISPR-associated protein Cas7/Cse4/CasC n=1 Tax=Mycolicibacterium llatzerense TaxID=280871 RepID=UPI0021B6CC1F|nr:type I-E CRISPR-associated protein Cas7/Cse4/CasC [Mycolicibacterium llatzerense]MCT7372659.1 type I-E CRISPR-associated protein Cas7/Cse4/CasC [Mycolicibacterium llatzerense]